MLFTKSDCSHRQSSCHEARSDTEAKQKFMLHQRKVLEVVKINIAAAQTRQKEQYMIESIIILMF